MEVEEEEDTVVEEIPVYLTQPDNPLFIFQYLNQPGIADSLRSVTKSKLKPENEEVELELELETRSSCYSRSMGEQLAINCDGHDANEQDKLFPRNLVDKQFLKSEKVVVENKNMTIGLLHDRKITLAPVSSVLALKPHLPYLDKTDKRAKQELKNEGELSEGEEEEEDNSIAKAVTVKFARRENERMKKSREKSFNYIQSKSSEEAWYQTKFCDTYSKESILERNKLKGSLEDRLISMTIEKNEYVKYLIPDDDDHETWKKDEVVALRDLKQQPLADQVKLLLRDVKIISMSKLKSFLNVTSNQDDSLKKYLQQHGLLVQGNWVVKSDILYPKESTSSICGLASDVMCRTRDYMIILFSQNTYVQKPMVLEKMKIPDTELTILFKHIAQYHPGKGWKLVLPPDESFTNQNPDIVERQRMWYNIKHKQINETIAELAAAKSSTSSNRKNSSRSRNDSSSDKESTRQRRNSTRSRHDSSSDVETSRQRRNSARSRNDSTSDKEMKSPKKNQARKQFHSSNENINIKTDMESPTLKRKLNQNNVIVENGLTKRTGSIENGLPLENGDHHLSHNNNVTAPR